MSLFQHPARSRPLIVPVLQQHNGTFSGIADFSEVGPLRIVWRHLLEDEMAVPDDDAYQVLHVVHELAIRVQSVNLSSTNRSACAGYVRSLPAGGGSLTTAQNAPSWRTASMNDRKSTGFTT